MKIVDHRVKSGYQSVLHFTIGNDNSKYGDRIPGVFLIHKKLHIGVSINGLVNYFFESSTLPVGQWIEVQIQQVLDDQKRFVFTTLINKKEIRRNINTKPAEFYNVKVYLSDPWYHTMSGFIRNLIVEGKYIRVKRGFISFAPNLV